MKLFKYILFFLVACEAGEYSKMPMSQPEAKSLLCNESLRSNLLLASTLIRSTVIKDIIEIGGICDSLCTLLPELNFIEINKKSSKSCLSSREIKDSVFKLKFNFLNIHDPFALVILNIDFNKGALLSNVPFFKEAIDAASLIILESSLIDSAKHDQLLELIALSKNSPGKEEKINIRLAINDNDVEFPEKIRHLVTFEKK